jgi:hypothetical protein
MSLEPFKTNFATNEKFAQTFSRANLNFNFKS